MGHLRVRSMNLIFVLVFQLLGVMPRPQESSLPSPTNSMTPGLVIDQIPPPVTVPLMQFRAIAEDESGLNLPTTLPINGSLGTKWDGPMKRCNRSYKKDDLNSCLRIILSDMKPRLADGIPEINLPPMDPLRLKKVAFQHGSGAIKLVAAFSNVEVSGLSKYNQSEFTVDMDRRVMRFDMGIPQMQIIGNYELSGNLFFLPIGGTGNFWLHMIDVHPKGRGNLEIGQNNNGQKHLQLKSINLDLQMQGLKIHLTNLFNGDKALGNIMNTFLNDNSMEIFAELRPQISRRVGEMVKMLTNKALSSLSSEYFVELPESSLPIGQDGFRLS